jgi:hypothetical protein
LDTSSGVAARSLAASRPITQLRIGEWGTNEPTLIPSPARWRLSRYSPKLTQSQRIPSRIDASGIASTRDISSIARSRSSGRIGAKPKPHIPIITVVTPFHAELVAYGSQLSWAS